jgi:hypothetical protein
VQPMIIRNRGEREVDLILGKKRKRPEKILMDFSKCPLALKYPSWDLFLEEIHEERKEAIAENRPMHPAAAPPPGKPKEEPVCPGMFVGQVKSQYGSKY